MRKESRDSSRGRPRPTISGNGLKSTTDKSQEGSTFIDVLGQDDLLQNSGKLMANQREETKESDVDILMELEQLRSHLKASKIAETSSSLVPEKNTVQAETEMVNAPDDEVSKESDAVGNEMVKQKHPQDCAPVIAEEWRTNMDEIPGTFDQAPLVEERVEEQSSLSVDKEKVINTTTAEPAMETTLPRVMSLEDSKFSDEAKHGDESTVSSRYVRAAFSMISDDTFEEPEDLTTPLSNCFEWMENLAAIPGESCNSMQTKSSLVLKGLSKDQFLDLCKSLDPLADPEEYEKIKRQRQAELAKQRKAIELEKEGSLVGTEVGSSRSKRERRHVPCPKTVKLAPTVQQKGFQPASSSDSEDRSLEYTQCRKSFDVFEEEDVPLDEKVADEQSKVTSEGVEVSDFTRHAVKLEPEASVSTSMPQPSVPLRTAKKRKKGRRKLFGFRKKSVQA